MDGVAADDDDRDGEVLTVEVKLVESEAATEGEVEEGGRDGVEEHA